MNQVREDINCDIVYSMGIMGKGVGVAVLDTSVYLHEDFKDGVTAFADHVNQRLQSHDDNRHGTHISAMIGESDAPSERKYRGVAPGCSLISVKVLDHKGNRYASDVLAGLRRIREHMREYGIRIVNILMGSLPRCDITGSSISVRGVNAAWSNGLTVVVATGNHGSGHITITTPEISHKVVTVGCSDDHKGVEVIGGRMVDCSSRGSTLACTCEPGVVAPGSGIVSCCNEPGRYFLRPGTGVSTPLVPGVIVLLLERYPEMSNKDVKLRIRERTVNLGLPHNQQGWGKLGVARLLEDQTSNRLVKIGNA